jgi:hypothetical protein
LVVLMALVLGVGSTLAFMTTPARAASMVGVRQIFGTAQGQGAANQSNQ